MRDTARRWTRSTTAKRSPPERGRDAPSLAGLAPSPAPRRTAREGADRSEAGEGCSAENLSGERRHVLGQGLACRQETSELLFRRILWVVHARGDRDKRTHRLAVEEDGTGPQ